jgi:hypothetical protein
MAKKVDSKKAEAVMKRAGLNPLEPYLHSKNPWKSKHIKCGRIVSPTYNAIQRGQGGCIFCAGLAVEPDKAEKLFISKGLKPIVPYPGQNKLPWKSIHLQCGREVSPSYNLIQQNFSKGCQFCSDQFVDPEEAYQFFLSKNLQPLVPYPGTAVPWKSIHLICGSEIKPRYGHIKAGRKGCPVCAGVVPISQKRAFAFFRSNGLEPQEKFKGPHHPWKSIHKKCGRVVTPQWASVQQGGGGCAYCSGNKIDKKDIKNILKANQLKPLEVFPGGSKPWKCIHIKCGREVSPRYAALRAGQGPCEFCGKNMISESEAMELLQKNNFKPLEKFPGGSKPWRCLHLTCKKETDITTTYLRAGGKGCNICAGLAPIPESIALKLFKSRGFTPLVKFRGRNYPWKSKHNVCGKTVSPTYGSIKAGGGCKYCQIGGINLLAPAYLYLITSTELNSHKIGIGGFDSSMDRLDKHIKQGWKTYNKIDLDTAEEAYEIEQGVLNWLRNDLNLQQYLLPEQMPQRGHTETVDASEIELSTIWEKVKELSRVKI